MIQATIQGNRVVITADAEARDELKHAFMYRNGISGVEQAIAEGLHEKWEFIDARVIGALTDSPILAECDGIERDENTGDITKVGKVCWFPDYAIKDPWFLLTRDGEVAFDLAD
jgi:hypothetical protein